jgi:hypothetical protein
LTPVTTHGAVGPHAEDGAAQGRDLGRARQAEQVGDALAQHRRLLLASGAGAPVTERRLLQAVDGEGQLVAVHHHLVVDEVGAEEEGRALAVAGEQPRHDGAALGEPVVEGDLRVAAGEELEVRRELRRVLVRVQRPDVRQRLV